MVVDEGEEPFKKQLLIRVPAELPIRPERFGGSRRASPSDWPT